MEANEISEKYFSFLSDFKTLSMATLSEVGKPHLSYCPFVFAPESSEVFILISEIAEHTKNILFHPKLTLMLIEDESKSQKMFARKRLTLFCSATQVERDDGRYEKVIGNLKDRHGEIISTLSSMSDFRLFCLCPLNARMVLGFGEAYHSSTGRPDDLAPLRRGHGKKN
ncbi:MAG: hypothetical protein HOE90_18730 [Bacteriovoracaceae bacterium]|nr:hypothetical protein [Bacteriovoracaceae bacterium]